MLNSCRCKPVELGEGHGPFPGRVPNNLYCERRHEQRQHRNDEYPPLRCSRAGLSKLRWWCQLTGLRGLVRAVGRHSQPRNSKRGSESRSRARGWQRRSEQVRLVRRKAVMRQAHELVEPRRTATGGRPCPTTGSGRSCGSTTGWRGRRRLIRACPRVGWSCAAAPARDPAAPP